MSLADLALEAPGVWTIIGAGVGMLSGFQAETAEETIARTVAGGAAGLAVSLTVLAIRAKRYPRIRQEKSTPAPQTTQTP